MGDSVSKFQVVNSCINKEETPNIPRYHFKCRFSGDDEHCTSRTYTRTKDIFRCPVPRNKIKWSVEYDDYNPVQFSSQKILAKDDGLNWKDPHCDDKSYVDIRFNTMDKNYNCDRMSHHGPYVFMPYSNDDEILVPCNPVGRTGLYGRGHLGRWGPNHAADPVVTRWKRGHDGKVLLDPNTNKKILEFVAIQRRDTKEWAIPGGMRDPGEVITKTLIREFSEEALSHPIKFDKTDKIVSSDDQKHLAHIKENLDKKLELFFRNGTQIYKGYVDDPRNTDNSWMETICVNFHDEHNDTVGGFSLEGGDDAEHAQWMELKSSLKLFASHIDFLREVAILRNANW